MNEAVLAKLRHSLAFFPLKLSLCFLCQPTLNQLPSYELLFELNIHSITIAFSFETIKALIFALLLEIKKKENKTLRHSQ